MQIAQAINTLTLRLYDWSLRDFQRELDSDCPLLRQIGLNDRCVAALVEWNNQMSVDDRGKLARSLPGQMQSNALRLRGEYSPIEKTQTNEWYLRNIYRIRDYELPPLQTAVDPNFKKVVPERCLDVLQSVLTPALGKSSRQHSSVTCRREVGDWKIITKFIFRRKWGELTMTGDFARKDGILIRGEDRPVQMPTTLLMFYGIGDTTMQVPSCADGERVPVVMVKLAEHFLVQSPAIFAGLGIED